jgi:hypothetical protein
MKYVHQTPLYFIFLSDKIYLWKAGAILPPLLSTVKPGSIGESKTMGFKKKTSERWDENEKKGEYLHRKTSP